MLEQQSWCGKSMFSGELSICKENILMGVKCQLQEKQIFYIMLISEMIKILDILH